MVGVGSHLVLDMVPHWGCDTRTSHGRQNFLRYARRDGLARFAVMALAVAAVDRRNRAATLSAMVGAAVLDADKPMIRFFARNPFPMAIRRIHARAQNESPQGMPKRTLLWSVVCSCGRGYRAEIPAPPLLRVAFGARIELRRRQTGGCVGQDRSRTSGSQDPQCRGLVRPPRIPDQRFSSTREPN